MIRFWNDENLVWRVRNVLLVEPDPDTVLPGLVHHVGDVAGAVLPVQEVDLSLAGTLNRDGERPRPRLSRPDIELGRLAFNTAGQSGATW